MSEALKIRGCAVFFSSGCFWILTCSCAVSSGRRPGQRAAGLLQAPAESTSYVEHLLELVLVMWEKLWDMPVYLVCNMRRWRLTCFWWPFIWIYSQTYRIVTNMEWEASVYILPNVQLFTFFPICFGVFYIHVNYVLNQWRVSWRHHTPLSLDAMYIFPKSKGSLTYLLFFWPCCVACGMISVHSPGIDWTWASVVKALNPNHGTAGKFPRCPSFSYQNKFT